MELTFTSDLLKVFVHFFVSGIRNSLSEIKDVSGRLLDDAQTSKTTAEDLEEAANNQSASMTQIRENIDNMASVSEEQSASTQEIAENVERVTEAALDGGPNSATIQMSEQASNPFSLSPNHFPLKQ